MLHYASLYLPFPAFLINIVAETTLREYNNNHILMKNKLTLLGACCLGLLTACQPQPQVSEWISTTYSQPWQTLPTSNITQETTENVIKINTSQTAQAIEGFGTCFNELGWTSLNLLDSNEREDILNEMFTPGAGANFKICRMPVAANDFSIDWYSYNETDGDFEMKNFSIENDRKTLIPFINAAKQFNSDIRIWASPWCPPTWMKYNKHYASRSTPSAARQLSDRAKSGESTYMYKVVDNELPEDRQGAEGTDMFIQDDKYMEAYALYFSKFIDAYRAENIDIFAVMPQNEFNSAQIFPSCCWTAKGLAKFVGQYLGPAMEAKGVDVMFGTMERPNVALVDTILQDKDCSRYIKGVGFQWAGKDALPGVYQKYPDMKLYQTEQECGNGKNDWKGALHSWDLMKHYLNNGVSVYTYWNTSLLKGGISRWGWAQNSLVVVDDSTRTYTYTPEYYVIKHASHYVLSGARRIELDGNYKDALCFINPNKSIVLIVGNSEGTEQKVTINIEGNNYTDSLPANSLNTLVINK